MTRSELVREAGLPESTVIQHVRTLLRQGVVLEVASSHGLRPGRPPTVLATPAQREVIAAAVLRHGERLAEGIAACGLVTRTGEIIIARSVDAQSDPVATVAHTLRSLTVEARIAPHRVQRAVLGVPFPLLLGDSAEPASPQSQVVRALESVVGSHPHQRLARMLGMPAALANDVDLAAIGEARFGVGRRTSSFLYVHCSTGEGAGLVHSGRVMTAVRTSAGELAHVQDESGRPCVCGAKSCTASQFPGGYVLPPRLRAMGTRATTLDELRADAASDHPATIDALHKFGQYLGRNIAAIEGVYESGCIVLEAALGSLHEPLAEGISRGLARWSHGWLPNPWEIVVAEGGPYVELRGAAVAWSRATDAAISL